MSQDDRPTPSVVDAPVEYLLISTPNLVAENRVRHQLMAGWIRVESNPLGLRVDCRGLQWWLIVESIATVLSAGEMRATRVAIGRASNDPQALGRAIFQAQTLERVLEEMNELWLRPLLDHNAIQIHFQPIVQYPPGRLHGYECLVRGVDPDGNLISPARLFAAAEKLDLLGELDAACRTAAIRAAGAAQNRASLNFFINCIPSAIKDPKKTLVEISQQLLAAGLRPNQITFEVVETDPVPDQRHLLSILRYYRKAGFKIALDDLGAGYASLLSMAKLRPDYIKIDRELMARAAQGSLEARLVHGVAQTARENDIIPIAEGIETERELAVAYECGIRLTQGYLHARPMPRPLNDEEFDSIVARLATLTGRESGTGHRSLALPSPGSREPAPDAFTPAQTGLDLHG